MPRVGGRRLGYSSSDGEDVGGMFDQKEGLGDAAGSVFEQYMTALEGEEQGARDGVFVRGLARVREYLAGTSADGASACLICLGTIGPQEAIWSCRDSCFAVLHLTCIQEWARNQVEQHVLRTMNKLPSFPAAQARAEAEWGCPKCRCAYPVNQLPSTYWCFCGKVEEPEWDPWRAPHSCGDMCGRLLGGAAAGGTDATKGGGCNHTCLLLCHPGPCPPCPLVVDAVCHCGRRTDRRRCGRHEFSCGGVCGATLECGHSCPLTCHEGECPPCEILGSHKCACGAESRKLPCAERTFQCARVCGKHLPCGHHNCERVCHAGPCGGCPFEGVRTCPCGKATYSDISCTDKAPTCGATCGKLLPCGLHRCQDRCHTGDCATCRATITKECRCGKTSKEVLCSTELLCDRRCANMRACGRHPCKRRCCDGTSCPPCDEVCGRKLRCGNHRCPAPCHSGPCRPCPLTVTYSCACSGMAATLPCGAESRALPPRCYKACAVPRLCRHARQGSSPALPSPALQHRCHFGPCPPCSLPCGMQLGCGHVCASPTCHDPPPPPVPAFTQPAAPRTQLQMADLDGRGSSSGAGAPSDSSKAKAAGSSKVGGAGGNSAATGKGTADTTLPPAMAVATQVNAFLAQGGLPVPPSPCPPCMVPVGVSCVGGHEQTMLPCSSAAPYVCTRPCGAPLACGNHTCALPCHAKSAPGALHGVPCQPCTQPCRAPRVCAHACQRPCHTGPCPACEVTQGVPCHCSKTTIQLPCAELQRVQGVLSTSSSSKGTAAVMSSREAHSKLSCGKPCHKQLPHCPHYCTEVCHSGSCPGVESCAEEVTVRCECKRQKAKWMCIMVQAALEAAGRPSSYDDTTPLRLLPCDKECAAAAAQGGATPATTANAAPAAAAVSTSKGKGVKTASPVAAAAPPATAQGAAAPAAAVASSKESKQATAEAAGAAASGRLSKAERQALAERKEAERRAAEKKARITNIIIWVVLLVSGLALGVYVQSILGF